MEESPKEQSKMESTEATFSFQNEDHTLGNALRYSILQDPKVSFCAYTMPHPSEQIINLRIQSDVSSAKSLLKDGLKRLIKICDILEEKFISSLNESKSMKE